MYFGVYFGVRRGFVFCMGDVRSQESSFVWFAGTNLKFRCAWCWFCRCWQMRPDASAPVEVQNESPIIRKAPDTFNFLRHVMRAVWSVRPKCSHRCVSLKETSLKPVQALKHTTKNLAKQTAMRTKWFKHITIKIVQAHLLHQQHASIT